MKKYLFGILILSLAACSLDFGSDNDSDPDPQEFDPSMTFNLTLSGSQEVPAVMTDNMAQATIEYDAELMQFRAQLDASNVDDFTAAHIHQGYVGTNGEVAFAFEPSETAGMYHISETMIDQAAVDEMLDGGWYINVHTQDNPSGDLRGQILTEEFTLLTFKLSGHQEVPAVDTDAMGYGYATYHQTSGELNLKVTTLALQGANAAHIHTGRIGMNGGVAIALSQGSDDNQWMTPDETTIDSTTFETLISGGHYVNVHTTAHASGEIRGQILTDNLKLLTFSLDGEQEVPAVSTDASGSGYALVNMDDNALELKVVTSGVDDATAAHIHSAAIGTNGGVLIALEQSSENMGIWAAPEDSNLTEAEFNMLMEGGHYVNVHTPAHASGEIRGQILTDNFVLMTFSIEGSQEVPPVTTDAMGSGYALVNLANNELELKAVTSGVSDATAAHIHTGILGINGGVAIALEQDSADDNIWMTPADTMLEQSVLDTLMDAGHYVNIHTPANAAGEIRGQIIF